MAVFVDTPCQLLAALYASLLKSTYYAAHRRLFFKLNIANQIQARAVPLHFSTNLALLVVRGMLTTHPHIHFLSIFSVISYLICVPH